MALTIFEITLQRLKRMKDKMSKTFGQLDGQKKTEYVQR